jgi:hypothetical protein
MSVTIKSLGGRVAFEARETRSSTELTGGRGGFGYSLEIPLQQFEPGPYVLRVEGRSRVDTDTPGVGRDVLIRVK